jgi:hypothetical protein
MIDRRLKLPPCGQETFFLWGPRQTGKSTLLRATYPDAYWVDLLKADEYRGYLVSGRKLHGFHGVQKKTVLAIIPDARG